MKRTFDAPARMQSARRLLAGLWLLFAGTLDIALAEGEVAITNRLPPGMSSTSAPLLPPGTVLDRLDVTKAIQSIYATFIEGSRRSGQELSFTLSHFKTYRREQFQTLRVMDVTNFHAGPVVETTRHSFGGRLPSQERVSYRSEWKPGSPEAAANFERLMGTQTIGEVLAADLAFSALAPQSVAGLTTFRADLQFEGQAASYSAVVFWRELDASLVFFSLSDQVVNASMMFHVLERETIVTPEALGNRSGAAAPPSHPAAQCVPTQGQHRSPISRLEDATGHNNGRHQSILIVDFVCEATPACVSSCSATPFTRACADSGEVTNFAAVFHRTHSAPHSWNNLGLGVGIESDCGFALGCATQECNFLTRCGGVLPTFTVNVAGAGFELTAAGPNLIADQGLESGATCPAARFAITPPPPRCEEQLSSVVALDLSQPGLPKPLGEAEVPLRRLEASDVVHHGEQVSYLMAEWAVVESIGGQFTLRNSSSGAFGEGVAKELASAFWSGPTDSREKKALFVALPPHEANSRAIPIPALRLVESAPQPTRERGRILVRADFGEDHRLQALDLVNHERLGSHELMLHIERTLSLEPSAAGHRVVVFAWLKIGERVEIESYLAYLPRCCCGTVFCV